MKVVFDESGFFLMIMVLMKVVFTVVTALVPEEDVWQFEVTNTCAREIQFQDGEQNQLRL